MPLIIVRDDITTMQVDAIVNAANESLLGGGGVDGQIHSAAGPQLLNECRLLNGCPTGSAKITKGYNLPTRHIIHAVGPVWQGGNSGEKQLLQGAYRAALLLAKEYKAESIAFPLISSGIYGYPKAEALDAATEEITRFLENEDMTVYLAVFDKEALMASLRRFPDIQQFIDDSYVEARPDTPRSRRMIEWRGEEDSLPSLASVAMEKQADYTLQHEPLASFLEQKEEGFSAMLLRLIDERGMTDAACYKKANIDRKLFSKIRSDPDYHPSKTTAVAFAIALEMGEEEARGLLGAAGYALSRSSLFDMIIYYFIQRGHYRIHDINEALFAYDQVLLGA